MLILFLLLLATLCIDAVAAYWWGLAAGGDASMALYYGLIFGQLSVLCVWASSRQRGVRYVWILPFAVGFLAAWITAALINSHPTAVPLWLRVFTCLFWIHSAALLALLWGWNQTQYVRSKNPSTRSRPWQVSVMQLLVVTSVVAVLLTIWRKTPYLSEGAGSDWIPWILNNVLVAISTVVIFRDSRNFFLRLALVCGVALCLGMILRMVFLAMTSTLGTGSFALWTNLFQAIVLVVWLHVGRIGITADDSVASDA